MMSRLVKVLVTLLNHSENPVKIVLILLSGWFLLLIDCTDRASRFQPTYYFPVHAGQTWIFDGGICKMEIAEVTKEVGDKIVTFAYSDSLNIQLWREKYSLLKNQLYLQSFEPMTSVLPTVTFDPPLPFAPISHKVGYKMAFECIETQIADSVLSTTQINVEYLIEAIEDVRVPAGKFLDCIKMKINIIYPQTAERPFFIGEQYWWFAPLIGPIKYDLPSGKGELVEINLSRSRQLEPSE